MKYLYGKKKSRRYLLFFVNRLKKSINGRSCFCGEKYKLNNLYVNLLFVIMRVVKGVYMEKFYSKKDIQKFLIDNNILWNGVVKDKNSVNNSFCANVKIFNETGFEIVEIYLNVDELTFEIYVEDCNICYQETSFSRSLFKDYSFEWTKMLIEKYPEIYEELRGKIESIITRIHKETENKINRLQLQISQVKEEENESVEIFKNVLNLIDCHAKRNARNLIVKTSEEIKKNESQNVEHGFKMNAEINQNEKGDNLNV